MVKLKPVNSGNTKKTTPKNTNQNTITDLWKSVTSKDKNRTPHQPTPKHPDNYKTPKNNLTKNTLTPRNNLTRRNTPRRKKDLTPDKKQPKMTDLVKFWNQKNPVTNPNPDPDTKKKPDSCKPEPNLTFAPEPTDKNNDHLKTRIFDIRTKFKAKIEHSDPRTFTPKHNKRKLELELETECGARLKSLRVTRTSSAETECPRRQDADNTGSNYLNSKLILPCPRNFASEGHMVGHVGGKDRRNLVGQARKWDSGGAVRGCADTLGGQAADREGQIPSFETTSAIGQLSVCETVTTSDKAAHSQLRVVKN